ncbi:MAG: hypothetical protein JXQ67_03115 [Campylobacterales bacterium]|nr:hypothetical protein [Campylobacterales bacterium]
MAYIFGLIVVGIFFLALHYYTELTKSQKLGVTAAFFSIVIGAIAYNAYSDTQREKMLMVVTKFQQNKTVHCNAKEVNMTNYDLSVGTYTFIGRENTPFYGEMISAASCE